MPNLFGSGTTETNQTTQNTPWPGVRKILNTGFRDALKMYQNQIGQNPGSNVVQMADDTLQGNNMARRMAERNLGGQGLSREYQNIINNGGFNDYQRGAMNDMRSQLNSLGGNGLTRAQDGVMGQFQRQLNNLGGNGLTNAQDDVLGRFKRQMNSLGANGLTNAQDMALANYRQTANRDYSIRANPGFLSVLKRAQSDATDAANETASAMGRYGSAIHQGKVASDVGDLTDRMVSDDYNRFLGRQDAANANMAALSQQGIGNIQNIGQSITGLGQLGVGNIQGYGQAIGALGQQGVQNRQGLSSNFFNAGQAGINNLGTAYEGMQAPIRTKLGIGAQFEDLQRRMIEDRNRALNDPWAQLNKLMGVAGYGSGYGTSNSTTLAPGPNPLLQTLGGASLGYSLLSNMGLLSGAGTPAAGGIGL